MAGGGGGDGGGKYVLLCNNGMKEIFRCSHFDSKDSWTGEYTLAVGGCKVRAAADSRRARSDRISRS